MSSSSSNDQDLVPEDRLRFCGLFLLSKGTTSLQFVAYLIATFFSISVFVFLNASQSFVLSQIVRVPKENLGYSTGSITFYDELLSFIMVGVWGILSDFTGRSSIYAIGFLLMSLGLYLFTFASNLYPELLLYRLIFALGGSATSSMLTAVLADLTDDQSRGRVSGMVGLFSGSGALLALFVFLRLPTLFPDAVQGLRNSYFIVASICLGVSLFVYIALKGHGVEHPDRRPSLPASASTMERDPLLIHEGLSIENCPALQSSRNIIPIVKDGLAAIKDPRIFLGYIGGYLARGDTIIITLFLPLWIYAYFIDSGKCSANAPNDPEIKEMCREAYIHASILSGVAQTCALLGAPFFGWISDIIYRPLAVILAAFIGGAGYFWLFIITDPTANITFLAVSLVGLGEIGMVVCSLALVTGSYVPCDSRGSVAGVYSMFGALGILINTKVGGYLFDSWNRGGPFFIMGVGHAFCLLTAVGVVIVDCCSRDRRNH